MQHMKIAVDFDGVLYDYDGKWRGGTLPLPAVPGAVESTRILAQQHELVVYSTRGWSKKHRERMAVWLNAQGIPYHAIAAHKPNADVYIDDKALRFTTWSGVLSALQSERPAARCELAAFYLGQADNAGRILRNADAFGCDHVHFVACKPEVRGMSGYVPYTIWEDAALFWDQVTLPVCALHPRPSVPALQTLPPESLFLVGGESRGLTPAELSHSRWQYRIPAQGAYSCLTADSAVAIALSRWYAEWRQT